jgi:hypothetical protein
MSEMLQMAYDDFYVELNTKRWQSPSWRQALSRYVGRLKSPKAMS